MSKRTDLHRPSAIVPADYTFVCCTHPDEEVSAARTSRAIVAAHMHTTGGKFDQTNHAGSCYVCGAHALYLATYHHAATNTYIQTGLDCAEKMEMGEPANFRAFRKLIQAGLEAKAARAKAQALLAAAGISAAWALYTVEYNELLQRVGVPCNGYNELPYEETTLRDIVGKVVKYGSLSEAQGRFVGSLLTKIEGRAVKAAERAAEDAQAAPVPQVAGRVEIVGTVLTTKWQENQFGGSLKMLVKHATGYKLWGSVPSGVHVHNGDIVSFVARIERSDKDEKFGFFNRPGKAKVIQQVGGVS